MKVPSISVRGTHKKSTRGVNIVFLIQEMQIILHNMLSLVHAKIKSQSDVKISLLTLPLQLNSTCFLNHKFSDC